MKSELWIDGSVRETAVYDDIWEPARPSVVVGRVAVASGVDVDDAIASAHDAYVGWSALSAAERATFLENALNNVDLNSGADATLLSRETGKVLHESDTDLLVFRLRWNLALGYVDEVDASTQLDPTHAVTSTVRHVSLGVVTIIVPFNWPMAILAASLPAALLAGNTVIVKPPATAPLVTARAISRIAAQLPPGVLSVITGRDGEVNALVNDRRIAKVCFTGSVAGGARMMELASSNITRVTLELGGNDAAIVCADAVLDDDALDRMFAAVFDTSGQICMNIKRVFVHRSRLDELVAGLTERLNRVVLGDPLEAATTHGPLHTAAARDRAEAMVYELRTEDVRRFGQLPGGEFGNGHFVRPALVIDPPLTSRVVVEEQFAPILPIMPFDSVDDALSMSNDSWAGLGGSIWSASLENARRLGARLRVGYVWINDHGAANLDLTAPFGGFGHSGFGREQGLAGIRDFQDTRVIAVPLVVEASPQ